MQTFIEILKLLTPVITSVLMLGGTLLKLRADNKSMKKKIDEFQDSLLLKLDDENKKQTGEIALLSEELRQVAKDVINIQVTSSRIENDVKELNELHKHSRYIPALMQAIDKEVTACMEIRELKNSELQQIFKHAAKGLKNAIREIIESDFSEVNSKVLFENIKIAAKQVRSTINFENLGLKNPENFLYEIKENILIPRFSKFSTELSNAIKQKSNGQRRQATNDIVLHLVSNVIGDVITVYNKSEKKQA